MIVIEGLAMPKGEDDGILIALYDGKAHQIGTKETFTASEVPAHGRLIDADKIGLTNFEIILCQKGNPYKNALEMLLKKIENAPTIIPAENGEI